MSDGPSQLLSGQGPVNSGPAADKATLLVVDDEPAVRRVLVMRLQLAGYRVVCAEDGEEALELFHRESPDLVVLDVMLPKLDGFAVCRRLRAESCVPIIFLSALEAISERVAGLDLGADDYLPKPFSPKEVTARVKAVLRRSDPDYIKSSQSSGFQVNPDQYSITLAGQKLDLTPVEFRLLSMFIEYPNRVYNRDQILNKVFETNFLIVVGAFKIVLSVFSLNI